jgi:predicted GTPase
MTDRPAHRRVLILGAAGRDFHDFNVVYRNDPAIRVVAFTATQIPGIAGRRYPASLAGPLYPEGIEILAEDALEEICRARHVDEVVFAYSDVPHAHVMHLASRAIAAGCDFTLLGPTRTMLRAHRPVVAVSAVRTGCGKSQIARHVAALLRARDLRVAVLRHPMPYGDLARERVQRFATHADLAAAGCTIEEREEYEPHLAQGNLVFAGTDYAAVLAAAEHEADILVWDGGNNDFPFLRPDLHIVVADALRPDQVATHHPGEAVARMADIVVVNKVDGAPRADVDALRARMAAMSPRATIVEAASPVTLDAPEAVRGRRVILVDDGPTITHGGMPHGAALVAARAAGAGRIVDPRASATPELRAVFDAHPHIGPVLPAMGYGAVQLEALRRTIADSDAEIVVSGTPIDLAALIDPGKPVIRARYGHADAGTPRLADAMAPFLATLKPSGSRTAR